MRPSTLALWHLLSLDAPTVATLWTCFIARCCGVALPPQALAAMFVAVWMLYAADRLLDARTLDTLSTTAPELEARHHFHHRHRRGFLAGIALAAVALTCLLPSLFAEALRLFSLLGALLFAWFLLIHTRLAADRRLPKELAVAIFFPAAVFIPTVARVPSLRPALLLPAVLFAAVCALNCLFLYAWEHPADLSRAHWTTRFALRHQNAVAALTTGLATGLALVLFRRNALWPIPAACAVAALLTLLLHRQRRRLSALHLRSVADLALLTPLLFAPFLHA